MSSAVARSSASGRSRAGTGSRAIRPTGRTSTQVVIACRSCGGRARRIPDVGNPWLDAGIVPFSTLHYREDPDYWAKWFPADFITESFPGQFRNWFYAMLAMSTVLRREPPFLTIFGYATLFGEDGRPMHKSWGNAIEFDEAAERMGVDVMRWLYMSSRPDDNILFGWHAADEARRRLLVLWNVYAFFVTYARLAGWTPGAADPPPAERAPMDRWILSRSAALAAAVEERLRAYDAMAATRLIDAFIEDLSTWFLRLSRRRFSRGQWCGPGRRLRDAARHARGACPDRRADPAVRVRRAVPEPPRGDRPGGSALGPPHPVPDAGAGAAS